MGNLGKGQWQHPKVGLKVTEEMESVGPLWSLPRRGGTRVFNPSLRSTSLT